MAMTTAPIDPVTFQEFGPTVVARWVERLSSRTSSRRNHWQTKLVYYRAAVRLLETVPAPKPTWRNILKAADGRGCRSTFYEVAGSRARHSMVDELISDGSTDSIQIALRYLRSDPVEQLIDETKVWSFWPYRQGLTRRLAAATGPEAAEQELAAALLTWAGRNQALAAAVGHAPPACAVEDLSLIHGGRVSGTQAEYRLRELLAGALPRP